MSTFEIGILGPLAIACGGTEAGDLPKKGRALLGYLAAHHGRIISREQLSDLLWPYQSSPQARHSLRNCLCALHKALGREAAASLVADASGCALRGACVDIERFEALSRADAAAELQIAADLYRGKVLADCEIDSEPFHDWLTAERERYRDRVCEVLQRLCAERLRAKDHEHAISAARRLVGLDSFSEAAHRALIGAYIDAGRRSEAFRQYQACVEMLRRELGVAPDPATEALAAKIAGSNDNPAENQEIPAAPLLPFTPVLRPRLTAPARSAAQPAKESARWPCLLPSIDVAVSPLRNLTGDEALQSVVDALNDDLITALVTRGRGLWSARIVDDRGGLALSRSARREIGLSVAGGVQQTRPGGLRINFRVAAPSTGEFRWAASHEIRVEKASHMQKRITRELARELHFLLIRDAARRASLQAGKMAGVAECLSRAGAALAGKVTRESTAEAQGWLLGALARNPRNITALVRLGETCSLIATSPWWSGTEASSAALNIGCEAIATALDLAPFHANAYCVEGFLVSAGGDPQGAAPLLERALSADSTLASAHAFAGYNHSFLGRAGETEAAIERAMRLDGSDRRRTIWFFFAGFAALLRGATDDAITLFEKSRERDPAYGCTRLFLGSALALRGRARDAAAIGAEFHNCHPRYRLSAFEQQWVRRSQSPVYRSQIQPIYQAIRQIGIDG